MVFHENSILGTCLKCQHLNHNFQISGETDFDVEKLDNETRQLEAIAFPVGIAIGAIGAAIIPAIFPGSTTTTTTTEKTLVRYGLTHPP